MAVGLVGGVSCLGLDRVSRFRFAAAVPISADGTATSAEAVGGETGVAACLLGTCRRISNCRAHAPAVGYQL